MRSDFDAEWDALAEEVLSGMKEWRLQHLKATLRQIEAALDERLGKMRARFAPAINAATDNPLIFPTIDSSFRALSGGNFHGQGPAQWLDFLGIALAEVANIAERRIFRLLTPELSGGLPAMLVPSSGLDSGLMMVQYTAAASPCSCTPTTSGADYRHMLAHGVRFAKAPREERYGRVVGFFDLYGNK